MDEEIYVTNPDGSQEGPYTYSGLKGRYCMGKYPEGTLIRYQGADGWLPIEQVFGGRLSEQSDTARAQAVPPPPSAQAQVAPPPPPDAQTQSTPPPHQDDTREVYVSENGQQRGPFTVTVLRQMRERQEVSGRAVYWMPGMSEWKPVSELLDRKLFSNTLAAFDKTLPKLQGFSLSKFFSAVFKHHTREEMFDIFCCGTAKTTPDLMNINPSWPAPWVFARMLVVCVLLYLGFTWAHHEFNNDKLFPCLIFVGTFGVPFCVFILFFELNVRRDVSLYDAIKGLIIGGLLSLVLSLVFFSHTAELHQIFGAPWAGPVEETGKLLIVILIASGLRNGRILTGLLMGAAVGAGFAAFESAGYVFEFFIERFNIIIDAQNALLQGAATTSEAIEYIQSKIVNTDHIGTLHLRALIAPIAHVLWTAITAGAYWMVHDHRVKEGRCQPGDNIYDWATLKDKRFLRIAIIPVLLHMFNNCGVLCSSTTMLLTARWAAGLVGWIIALRLVQKGLHQIREEQEQKLKEESTEA